ncbi:MAG: type VI secretion system ATPase TssH, partial [Gammaproteobacteria bacterium]
IVGRDEEIRQIVDILMRRRQNNPILTGEAGVGKTAVVEGFALRIASGDVPPPLEDVTLRSLDIGLLQAGASVKGEFEKRLTQVLKEVHADPTIILFIDEAHTLIGSGGQQGTGDAANLLKPALARGEIRAMAATTWSEYKKYFEKDPALARRFQLVKLDEPSALESATIMRGLRSRYEQVHRVYIRDDAVVAAAELSARFIAGRQLPDKAIDVLDTACARVSIGLSAKPASLDDQEREIQALERKRDALRRDLAVQFKLDNPELAEMETEIQRLGAECEVLRDRWQRERAVVDRIVELRARLHELTDAPEEADTEGKTRSEALSEIQVDLEIARGELLAVTGDAPLVPYEVTPEVVGKVISDWTGVPLGKVVRDEAQTLLDFVARMRAWVLGQDSALTLIGDRIRASKAGLGNPNQPIAVFMLPGPSGVGKTETALAVADLLFGGRHSLISINMSEFQEKHTVSRLIGSPPGYVGYGEGGVLSEAVRQRPYSVVLLDEVEKGHPDVMNLFYQVFDKGELADGEGRLIDFKNTVLFLTSNLASDVLVTHCLQNESVDDESLRSAIRPVLADFFRPALLARMDIVPYRPLSQPVLSEIIERKLNGVAERLEESHDLGLDYSSELLAFIRERCTEFESGARNIETVINRYVLPPLSRHLLEGREEEAAQSRGVHLGIGDDNDVAVTRMAA